MPRLHPRAMAPLSLSVSFFIAPTALAQLSVDSVEPGMNVGNVQPNAEVAVHFDRALDAAAFTGASGTMRVFGKGTGPASGTWSLDASGTTARFAPDEPFAAGEVVQVTIPGGMLAADGTALRSAGYHFEYRIRTRPSDLEFTNIGTMSVRSNPNVGIRVYGGQATDLDDDGWLDLAIVNQNTSDIRVLLNEADGTGTFTPFLTPEGTGDTPSPNESCDLNEDGLVDIVTGDKFGDTVSVLLGRGDGTFEPRVTYSMGDLPRGLAVFDANGDGHGDVVCTNATGGTVSIRLGNGDGTLGAESVMNGGGLLEWGLASGDMNEDGIMDFIVGAQTSQRLIVWLGNGDGTFSQGGVLNGVDRVWMIVPGDVNGDGHLDVSTGNGVSSTGTIAFGDGTGNLTLGPKLPAGGLVVATDLGDLDGDGDLDWILSAYSGERWTLYENDGTGSFTLKDVYQASENPACAVLFDFDRDEDLDMVHLDEIADELVFWENTPDAVEFCTPVANSTGAAATVSFMGSRTVAANDFTLQAGPMPDGVGFFFYGQSTGAPMPAGNAFLCLTSSLFRSPIGAASGGLLDVTLDLTQPPVPAAAIVAGSTWSFQCVFRDVAGGGAFFSFSSGLSITFE